jgi:hypothetical protein
MGDNWVFPSFEDYTGKEIVIFIIDCFIFELGSAIGLMRLQDTYKLKTSELANGEISSNFKSRKLSGE